MEFKDTVEHRVLSALKERGEIVDSTRFAQGLGVDHQLVVGVLNSLASANMISIDMQTKPIVNLTEQGQQFLKDGTPEALLWNAIPEGGIDRQELFTQVGSLAKIGFAQAMRLGWVRNEGGKVSRKSAMINDEVKQQLEDLNSGIMSPSDGAIKLLKKRKLVTTSDLKVFSARPGPEFSMERKQKASDLTAEMLQSGEWQNSSFKEYNFKAKGKYIEHGALHPLLKVREQFRSILLEMGFEEMPTNQFVESSFWNFDSLFQPQQHPARDAHDTFFVTKPETTLSLPNDYVERVKQTHQEGGFGSIGWRYDWSLDEAKKNLLRTHTTAVSSKMLYKLAQGTFQPKKYFSIDRVFRNETIDATHLAEFHQVEGLVADRNLKLGDLIGVIAEFFRRIGISDVKFKPAYNPYTEPSMEIFGYSSELGKWMEVGNSGVFRPEMLRPMGLPEDVTVIAWGFGLERPTMIKYGFKHIRDLFGHKVNLRMCQKNPHCRFDQH